MTTSGRAATIAMSIIKYGDGAGRAGGQRSVSLVGRWPRTRRRVDKMNIFPFRSDRRTTRYWFSGALARTPTCSIPGLGSSEMAIP